MTARPSGFPFNFLTTLSLFLVLSTTALANLKEEKFKTHLRWGIVAPKDQLYISKKNNTVTLETLNFKLFEKIVKDLSKVQVSKKYFSRFAYDSKDYPAAPAKIVISLKDKSVELFSFYKDSDKQYLLDFWIDQEKVAKKVIKPIVAKKAPVRPTKLTKVVIPKKTVKKAKIQTVPSALVKKRKRTGEYRDFRYGAAFVWDYEPILPTLKAIIDLENKTPEYFYPISNRKYEKDDKEAHMQLSINLFRKGKWGLMYKSVKLYYEKYAEDNNQALNEYLKANALLRSNQKDKNKGITNTANNIFLGIIAMTETYELKGAILKYLVQYFMNSSDYIQALDSAKKLYIVSKEDFDEETSIYAATAILHSLAKLEQVERIIKFVNEPTIIKLLPKQITLAYLTYVYSKRDNVDKIISLYNANKNSAISMHSAIVFNVAEAYFKKAEYQKAIKLFDIFLSKFSFMTQSSHSRLRIALAYDFLDRDPQKVMKLYENAVNRSSDPAISYEAKLRYVGMRLVRKKQIDKKDVEYRSFLDKTAKETQAMSKKLEKLLWLVRLRIFINSKKLDQALAYITGLPLKSMTPVDRRTFEGDGAEIVYGLIKKHYDRLEYPKAVRIWEIYRERYISKIALNPYLNFIICNSYMKLGLNDSFRRTFTVFKEFNKNHQRTYPIWIENFKVGTSNNMLIELELLRHLNAGEWKTAQVKLDNILDVKKNFVKQNYYDGLISYHLKDYKRAKKAFERFLQSHRENLEISPLELMNIVKSYVDTSYKLDTEKRFREIAFALKNDLRAIKNPIMNDALEKIDYLLIESLSNGKKNHFSKLDILTSKFKSSFKESAYNSRVDYLRAKNFIKNKEVAKGKRILQEIVKNQAIPSYIRELAQTELSSIELWSGRL